MVLALLAMDKALLAGSAGRSDAGLFWIAGGRWAAGQIPYRDFWDNKPPGIFAVNALYQALGGTTFAGLAWVEGAWSALGVAAFVMLSRAAMRPIFALVGLVVFALVSTQHAFTEGGNFTEIYLLAPAVASAWLVVAALRSGSPLAMAGAGLMAGCAAVFKPVGLAPALAAFATLGARRILDRRPGAQREALEMSVGLALGLVAAWLPWTIWAAHAGVLREMLRASLGYNVGYSLHSFYSFGTQIARAAFLLGRFVPGWVGLGWLVIIEARRARSRSGALLPPAQIRLFAMLWFLSDLAGVFAGRNGYGHYFEACSGSLAFGGILGLDAMWGGGASQKPAAPMRARRILVLSALALLIPLWAAQTRHRSLAKDRLRGERETADRLIAEARRFASPGEGILVWGHYFAIQARGGYAIPQRTLSLLHLAKSPDAAEWIGPELRDIARRSPPPIVLEQLAAWDNLEPLDSGFQNGGSTEWKGQREIAAWIRAWLAEAYAAPIRMEGFNFYVRKDRVAANEESKMRTGATPPSSRR